MANPSLNWLYEGFYQEGKKIIDVSFIKPYFTPMSLAIWIMDDGSKNNTGIRLCTDSFTLEECKRLAEFLTSSRRLKNNYKLFLIISLIHI